jgi:hypothetical protein
MFIDVSTRLHTHLRYCISLTLPAGVNKVKHCYLANDFTPFDQQ